jgi:hypothetical protein
MKVKQIPQSDLITGKSYVGRGRNGNVGLWDGTDFIVVGKKFKEYVLKYEPYYTEEEGCFQPFLIVDEGNISRPMGATGWDAHYAMEIEFPDVLKTDQEKDH